MRRSRASSFNRRRPAGGHLLSVDSPRIASAYPAVSHPHLVPGSLFGSLEVVAPAGQGGMGVVYRARDRRIDRTVALKVLPDLFATDPDRLARFDREARTLGALNHPNIAQIYGLEQSGSTRALVMEFVEGEDLSARIARGPIPVDEAMALAFQIAAALESAHELGIIHRDLKPANVRVREDGVVKVLDFGLAKAMETGSSVGHASATLTSPAFTAHGVILGTAGYMSPEQARGRAVDRRADIWAFGVVLYEMLTGARLFDGESVADTIALVVSRAPDMNLLPPGVPDGVRMLIGRCLEREPRQRLRDIGEARLILEAPATLFPRNVGTPRPTAWSRRQRLAWIAASAALTALAGAAGWYLGTRTGIPESSAFEHFTQLTTQTGEET